MTIIISILQKFQQNARSYQKHNLPNNISNPSYKVIILVHAQNTTLITETCRQTSNNHLCVSTLNSDRRTNTANDKVDIATILLLNANDLGIKTLNHIVSLLRSTKIKPQVRPPLNKCMFIYNSDIKFGLIHVVLNLSQKQYGFAKDLMEGVLKSAKSCEDNFAKVKSPSPISGDTKKNG